MMRPARPSDFEEVFAVYMDPAVNPFMSWDPMTVEAFQPIFHAILATGYLYAYELNDNLAAIIRIERYTHRRSHVAYIGGFGVSAKFQNQGLGSKILTETIETLREEGFKRIELIVESDNPRAIRLYEKLGFKIEGTHKGYFKRSGQDTYTDDYSMALIYE